MRPEDLTAAVARQLPEAPYPARPAANNDPREETVERAVKKAWAHRAQLVLFAVNGLNVFALGLLIQVLLVRYAGWGHVASYIAQTVASVQISFLFSRYVTWRDRDMATLPALARFNLQQLTVTGLGMAGYAALEQLGMNYIVANVAVTAALTPVSFLSSHKWSLAARRERVTGAQVRPSPSLETQPHKRHAELAAPPALSSARNRTVQAVAPSREPLTGQSPPLRVEPPSQPHNRGGDLGGYDSGGDGRLQSARENRHDRRTKLYARVRLLTYAVDAVAAAGMAAFWWGANNTIIIVLVSAALFNLAASSLEVRWRLYGRRSPQAREGMNFPPPVPLASQSPDEEMSIIVPALHESSVLGETLERLARSTYRYVQIVVSLHDNDIETIEAAESVWLRYPSRIKIITGRYPNPKKAKQLNPALMCCTGKYVGVMDAESIVHPGLLSRVVALFHQTGADIVQGGVQLMNLDLPASEDANVLQRAWMAFRGWFCVHNVLEYFSWFSSRMFYQADQGFVPLGGNTVFIRRDLLNRLGGWPPDDLTEDCALGAQATAAFNAKVAVAWDPVYATQEETPGRLLFRGRHGGSSLNKQRQRWSQGFLQVLFRGDWRQLPSLKQRLLARYILGMPYIQAANAVLLPVCIAAVIWLRSPAALTVYMFTPLIPVFLILLMQVASLHEFSRSFGRKVRARNYIALLLGYYPYQLALSWAAAMAAWRYLRKRNDWALTDHSGLHLRTGVDMPLPEGQSFSAAVRGERSA